MAHFISWPTKYHDLFMFIPSLQSGMEAISQLNFTVEQNTLFK